MVMMYPMKISCLMHIPSKVESVVTRAFLLTLNYCQNHCSKISRTLRQRSPEYVLLTSMYSQTKIYLYFLHQILQIRKLYLQQKSINTNWEVLLLFLKKYSSQIKHLFFPLMTVTMLKVIDQETTTKKDE